MNAEQFRACLLTIKNSKDSQEIRGAEAAYIEFRNQNPSDYFLQLLINELTQKSEVQQHAIVLLRQDINTNASKSALYRLQDQTMGRQLMIQLLQYVASQPNEQLAQAIALYSLNELIEKRPFEEVFDFVQQGIKSQTKEVREVCAYIISEICTAKLTTIQQVSFDFLAYLQLVIQDQADSVALRGIEALGNMLVNNEDESAQPIIPLTVCAQMLEAMIMRIVQAIQNKSFKHSEKMLFALANLIDQQGDNFSEQIPQLVSLAENIMQIQADGTQEEMQKIAVRMFMHICETCTNVRKQLKDMLQNFIRLYVIPGLVPSDQDIENWLNVEVDYEFSDNTMTAVCEECIAKVAFVLGKQIVNPLIHEIVESAKKSTNWKLHLAAVVAVTTASQGMADVCKQKDVEFYTEALLQFLSSEHPRVRFEVLNAITILSDHFNPKIQKMHKQIIPALCSEASDPHPKVHVHASTAMITFMHGLTYENVYEYFQIFQDLIRISLQQGIVAGSNALTILSSLCDIVDPEDMVPVLNEFMPQILGQFENIMDQIKSVPDFTEDQTIFIVSIVECIAAAAKSSPSLFNGYIEKIMQNYVIIINRSCSQLEHSMFAQTVKSMNELTDKFAEQIAPFVEQVYPLLINVLQKSPLVTSTQLETEGEVSLDTHVLEQQNQILSFLADFMDAYPQGFQSHFEELVGVMTSYKALGMQQIGGLIYCQAQLLHLATYCQLDANQVHNLFFKNIHGLLNPDEESTEFKRPISNLEDVADALDAVALYIRFYCQHYIACVKANTELPGFDETVKKTFSSLQYQHEMIHKLMNDQNTEVDMQQYDEEEQESAAQELQDQYRECMESVGLCYQQFVKELGAQIPQQMLVELNQVAMKFLSAGIDGLALFETVEGISLYADFSKDVKAEYVIQMFQPASELLIKYLTLKVDFVLTRDSFYCLYEYLRKTNDFTIANNSTLLNQCITLLEELKTDGSEEALGAYDNICSYMTVAGLIVGQPAEYWGPLMDYCMAMESDYEEIVHVLEFFLDQFVSNPAFKNLTSQVIKITVQLFFSTYYTEMKNKSDNSQIVQKVKALLQMYGNEALQVAKQSSSFVQKNFANFTQ
ncbi:Importin_beta-3 subunit [Hexamita inflata]|uniref:Importin beta-3 subunit n=1 Tax=Hexamita inflata TaxID=28002 RepID=A0AA86PUJ9_9EUKA|nr:Importin beta-3 subunit [Hexamita inflata]